MIAACSPPLEKSVTPGPYLDGMETVQTIEGAVTLISIFEDPVAYLGLLGIEAELVTVFDEPLAPAAA